MSTTGSPLFLVAGGLFATATALLIWAAARHLKARARARRTELMRQGLLPMGALPLAARDALPRCPFAVEGGATADRTCAICLADYEGGDRVCRLPCKHGFHGECIDLWFTAHSNCPTCRLALVPDQALARTPGAASDVAQPAGDASAWASPAGAAPSGAPALGIAREVVSDAVPTSFGGPGPSSKEEGDSTQDRVDVEVDVEVDRVDVEVDVEVNRVDVEVDVEVNRVDVEVDHVDVEVGLHQPYMSTMKSSH